MIPEPDRIALLFDGLTVLAPLGIAAVLFGLIAALVQYVVEITPKRRR